MRSIGMKILLIAILIIICVLIIQREIIRHLYLNIAIGRKTRLYEYLTKRKEKNKPEKKTEIVDFRERERKWIQNCGGETVVIKSSTGAALTGHYLKNPEAERIVIMFHGWRGSWDKDCGALGKGFYNKKCSLLIVEQRAQGASEGKYMGFGVLERHDCRQWLSYMTELMPSLPVYLSGVSMGASTVLMATELDLPSQVKGVIADCGFTTPYEMVGIFAKNMMHMKNLSIVDSVNELCKKKAGYDFKECSTLEAMKKCRIPIFFAHGKKDTFVPFKMTKRNFEACAAPKHFLAVEDAGHGQSYLYEPVKYMKEVEDFFGWETA